MASFRSRWLFLVLFLSFGLSACEMTLRNAPTATAPQVTSQAPLPPTPIMQPTATRTIMERYYIPTYYSAFYDDVILNSQSEELLVIYSSLNSARLEAPLHLFKERYPWVTISIIEDSDYALLERYTQEIGAGQRTADLFLLADGGVWKSLIEEGQIRTYRSEEDVYLPGWSRSAIGVYALALDPLVLAYNKSLLSAAPRSLTEIAALPVESYRGHIAVLDPHQSEIGFLANWYYTEARLHPGWQNLINISKKNPNLFNDPQEILASLNSGQNAVSYFLPLSLVSSAQTQYPNLGWSYDQEGQLLLTYHIGLSQAGASANTAKLLVDFLLSQEGQMAINTSGLTVFRPDVYDVSNLHLDKLSQQVNSESLIYFYFRPELALQSARNSLLNQWQRYFVPAP